MMSTHDHNIIDSRDPHYIIDVASRTVTNPDSEKVLLIQGDHNSERFSFDIARKIEGHDVLDCNHIQVHYWNKAASGRDEVKGFYEVTDISNKEGYEDDTVTFSWLISGDATTYEGKLMFSIMFYCVDQNGKITYRWGTQINNSMAIVSSLLNTDEAVHNKIDSFSEWESRIDNHIATSQATIDESLEELEREFNEHIALFETNFTNYVTNTNNTIIATLENLEAQIDEKVDAKIDEYVDEAGIQPTDFATESEVGAIFADETGNYEPGEYYVYSQVDTEIDETSENPVQNKVIAAALKNAGTGSGGNVIVDTELSSESENPVQNKIVTEALDGCVKKSTSNTGKLLYCRANGNEVMVNVTRLSPEWLNQNANGNIPEYAWRSGVSRSVLLTGTPQEDIDCANKKYVDDKFNGANKAVSFEDYETMISALNGLENTKYYVGQNVMIVTLEVPDLWVSSIAESNVTYTYTTDEDFVNALKTNGSVQVGYFVLSALETQKVDLSEYATKEELGGKVNYPTNNEQVAWGSGPYLIAVNRRGDSQDSIYYTQEFRITNPYFIYSLSANPIPAYKEAGRPFPSQSNETLAKLKHTIFIADCNENSLRYEAVNKGYVDDNKGTKLYKHTITVNYDADGFQSSFDIHFYSVLGDEYKIYYDENLYGIHFKAAGITNIPYLWDTDHIVARQLGMTEANGDDVYYSLDTDYLKSTLSENVVISQESLKDEVTDA